MTADTSTSIVLSLLQWMLVTFAVGLPIGVLVCSLFHLRRRVREARSELRTARTDAAALRIALEGEERQRDFLEKRCAELERVCGTRAAELEQAHEQLRWAARWRGQWMRTLLAQRWARSAAGYAPSDPQRAIYSAAAVALLLANDVEQVCRVMEQWIVDTPKGPDGVMERPTAESQAAQHWRVLVNEARDAMAGRVFWYVESEEGKPPPPQPPLEERLWRFLTGESPGQLDNWNGSQLERALLELLARAQLTGVESAAKRGHPREVAGEPVH